MVAVADMLHDNPEVRTFIQQLSEQAQELFPGVRIQIDAVQWEPYDPPVRVVLHIRQPWEDNKRAMAAFVAWLSTRADFDPELVGILPLWQEPDARA
ncbi:MAG: hypothetical protein QM589_14770 [Thermomicrobiales bacterium]